MTAASTAAHGPWPAAAGGGRDREAYADAARASVWLDTPLRPAATGPLDGDAECELAIVGAGLSGLWAALEAKTRNPQRDIVVLEATRIADGASGRNGGFMLSSLTHGVGNGLARFPDEMATLERLGLECFAGAVEAIREHRIDCALELGGVLDVAVEPHEVGWLAEAAAELRGLGHEVELLDREAARAQVHSPIYEAGMWQRSGAALIDPARMCWGLARVAGERGARVLERTPVTAIEPDGAGVRLRTAGGEVRARKVLLATAAFPGLIGAVRRRVVPVYDYVLTTEPLSAERKRSIGWVERQGIGDSANRFHYYRLTDDDRVLWGGYDAIYSFGSGLGVVPEHVVHPGLLGGWGCQSHPVPRRTPDERSR